jgi:2'-5' RNA ligase
MVHSIELLFDHDTEATIRQIWEDLAAAGIPSQAPASRPHVTLVVAERIAPDVDALLRPVAQLLFGRSNAVLARLIVPTAELLAIHAEVHRICGRFLLPGPMPNSLPDQWTAHVTLARRVGGAQLGRALRIAGRPSEIDGTMAGLRRWDGSKRVDHLIS